MELDILKKKYKVYYHTDKNPKEFDTREEAIKFLEILKQNGYYGELTVEERIRVKGWNDLKWNAKLAEW